MEQPKDATEATKRALAEFAKTLPPGTGADFELVKRGFIATIPDAKVLNEAGHAVWDMGTFAFAGEGCDCPDTVNPSLWRQAKLNSVHGLFEVTKGIYQVRNFDLSNITFIEGDTGYLVIDPLISTEPAAALALMRKHRGDKPVTGVIYTHSHVDHYGGIRGVLSDEDIEKGLRIIAPEGFLEEAVSENVLAGNAMGRRATYMYGALLPRNAKGHVDAGLGKTVSMAGEPRAVGEEHIADGHEDRRRWHRNRLPGDARHRGARRNEFLLPAVQGALHGRELFLPSPQHLHAARRAGARYKILELVHRRGDRAFREGHGCSFRQPSLAALGFGRRCRLPEEAARSL